MTYTLIIKPISDDKETNKYISNYYRNFKLNNEDSGVDLVIPTYIKCESSKQLVINHYIAYALYDEETKKYSASYLYGRSSISKTNFRLANSTGIIDKGYRGPILAKVDVHDVFSNKSNDIDKGTRLFQICSPNLEPISNIILTDDLPISCRGNNGFGSTGK